MSIVLNGTTGITNDGGYTGDGVVFADTTPANTLVTTTGGNVGIGTSSPSTRFEANTGAGGTQNIATIRSSNVQLKIGTTDVGNGEVTYNAFPTSNSSAAGAHVWQSGGTERARIDSSGNLLVGTPSAGLNVAGNGFALQLYNGYSTLSIGHTTGTGSGAQYLQFSYNGTGIGSITQNGTTAVAYNTSSDYRLKEDIQPMTGALAKVAALKPCTYKWKADGSDGEGFIAHELAEVVPQCVTGEKDAVNEDGSIKPQGIDTSFLVATLTAAIQEQQALIDAQQAALTALTARVEALEGTQP